MHLQQNNPGGGASFFGCTSSIVPMALILVSETDTRLNVCMCGPNGSTHCCGCMIDAPSAMAAT